MDKTDVGLLLGAFSALALFIGDLAALVVIAFAAGYVLGRADRRGPTRRESR
jgi:hypothetical protein